MNLFLLEWKNDLQPTPSECHDLQAVTHSQCVCQWCQCGGIDGEVQQLPYHLFWLEKMNEQKINLTPATYNNDCAG